MLANYWQMPLQEQTMQQFIIAITLITVGGILAFITRKNRDVSTIVGAGSAIIGSLIAAVPVARVLFSSAELPLLLLNLPLGEATLKLDAVSAFFSLPILALFPAVALYNAACSKHDRHTHDNCWLLLNMLAAAMLLLLASANALTFLIAWELMSVAAFFLIVWRDEIASARSAAWQFLIASHVGTAALMLLFALLSVQSGSLEFARFAAMYMPAGFETTAFLLAVFGFGVKVGLLPLHVWLPDSYTFADAPVSAILSGAMSKMGFYGLLRVLMLLPLPRESWGWLLVVGGLLTGIFALIMALAQSDIKKVVSYSSMENAGIILMAIGCSLLAMSWKQPEIAGIAMAGALLHILNHAVCKGLLFMGTGAIYWGTGTRRLELMGGLAGKMPFTAVCFALASVAIAGLPPFNSFISEFIIFIAGLKAAISNDPQALLLAAAMLSGLALIGGLAAATFARTFGLVFLGAARHDKKHEMQDISPALRLPFIFLLICMGALIVAAPWLLSPIMRVSWLIMARQTGFALVDLSEAALWQPVGLVVAFSLTMIVLVLAGWQLRRKFFSAGERSDRPTWDCGYAAPDARMQYTSSSFSQTIVDIFSPVVRPYKHGEKVSGLFPQHASFRTDTPDSLLRYLFVPLFGLIDRILLPLRGLQHGRLHLYICYVAITLLALLVWKVVAI
ncbi:MAG: Hydrogenase-4 component B [Candidatus Rifleibacterium amylolyticum]|nr:MAG: Hydrogenase-4 component B [Candidatus Rifleibacterium amylolyticum]